MCKKRLNVATKGVLFICLVFDLMPFLAAQYTLPAFEATPGPEMPQGIFSYHRSETALKNQFGVPEAELSDPMSIASELINTAVAESSSKQQALAGVSIPLPFRLKPLNLKLSQDSEVRMGMSSDNKDTESTMNSTENGRRRSPTSMKKAMAQLSAAAQMALMHARQVCLENSQHDCDAALEAYQRLRLGQSPRERENRLRESQPNEWSEYVQTNLAKWLVPGLDHKLDAIVLETTKTHKPTDDSSNETVVKEVVSVETEISERRRKPISLPSRKFDVAPMHSFENHSNTVSLPIVAHLRENEYMQQDMWQDQSNEQLSQHKTLSKQFSRQEPADVQLSRRDQFNKKQEDQSSEQLLRQHELEETRLDYDKPNSRSSRQEQRNVHFLRRDTPTVLVSRHDHVNPYFRRQDESDENLLRQNRPLNKLIMFSRQDNIDPLLLKEVAILRRRRKKLLVLPARN